MSTAASRKRSESTKTTQEGQEVNPRLELAKSIHALTQKMDAFNKAQESLTAFTKDHLVEFDMQIEAKKEDLKRLTEEHEHSRKRGRTETDLFLQEYNYTGAKKILSERGEVPISSAELETMKANLTRLTQEREKDIDETIKREKQRNESAMSAALSMKDLKHAAETAQLTATKDQQVREITSLNQTIMNLKEEVAQQRKLTEAVANAGRQAPITLSTAGK